MPVEITIENFLIQSHHTPVVDVRSPSEFLKGHIPGAINIPLFTDEERAEIGTLYVLKGKDTAVLRGLELVGPKMKTLAEQAVKLSSTRELLVHCWRGGMRSKSMAWLFEQMGLRTFTLKGGYKSYRQLVVTSIQCQPNFMVIGGMTGSGKTEILKTLKKLNFQILDLEGLANHKGSAFGALGQPLQPTQEQFENNLYKTLAGFDKENPIWVEDESLSIGKNQLPLTLFQKLQKSPLFLIEMDKMSRIQRLVKEYGIFSMDQLGQSIKKIEKRLGYDQAKIAQDALLKGNLELVAEITLHYYDKAYQFQIKNRQPDSIHHISASNEDSFSLTHEIISRFNQYLKNKKFKI